MKNSKFDKLFHMIM